MLLEKVLNSTDEYLNSKSKSDRKKIGQFFTSKETAIFMSELSSCKKRNIKFTDLLDYIVICLPLRTSNR